MAALNYLDFDLQIDELGDSQLSRLRAGFAGWSG
jgi:hypothetical protein